MDLIDQIKALSLSIKEQADYLTTEEATKNACVLPFIQSLGYNIFNPKEVVPEFTADYGVKKGEKVDYAILKDDKPIILFECKRYGTNLDEVHASQLYRYFSVMEVRVGILTNGRDYRIYADLEKPNKMDSKPFLEFDILNISESQVKEIKRFSKLTFDIEELLSTAGELKYTKQIIKVLSDQYNKPSESYVRFFIKEVYNGRATQGVIGKFTEIIKQAMRLFVSEKINERLETAFSEEEKEVETVAAVEEGSSESKGIVTTEEEIEGYHIVKAALKDVVDVKRIVAKDTRSYFSIIFDGNTWKPICRLHFNNIDNKSISLFYFEGCDRKEKFIYIKDVYDIFDHADVLRSVVKHYLNPDIKESAQ
ncbi:MAG TPA: type I restriction endonuclease [Acidobacteriota bacterium]|nr:type I restriction endonuclease [Acidobacteriota bacterium]